MLALKINDIKEFMNKLLIKDTFDNFEVIESTITTFSTFSINGKYQKDFFDNDIQKVLEENHCNYAPWKDIKPFCFSIIRGKRTPLQFKLIFQLPFKQIIQLIQESNEIKDIEAIYLSLNYIKIIEKIESVLLPEEN